MQQFSGSSGLGGTRTPAISVLFWARDSLREDVSARRGPKTRRARERESRVSSSSVVAVAAAVGGGDAMAVGFSLGTAGRRRRRVPLRESDV
jgi:hypothetical protein